MIAQFDEENFENGSLVFDVHFKPASIQNKKEKKDILKEEIHKITTSSEYIITSTCWIAIDYYCKHINRLKYPGVYDIDNIIKPIVDSLIGYEGLLIDDVIVDRVTVNWIDTQQEDYFEVYIEYPDLLYSLKSDFICVKSKSGWCFPTSVKIIQICPDLVKKYLGVWDSIKSEEDYYKNRHILPIQLFIYQNKINNRGYRIIDIDDI